MEQLIAISNLNDFLFCPASIYYHKLVGRTDKTLSNSLYQYRGSQAHAVLDEGRYSTRKCVHQNMQVMSEKYGFTGTVDVYDENEKMIVERKNRISKLYRGQIFQVYAQCIALREMGYDVEHLRVHSMADNRNYDLPLPEDSGLMSEFEDLIDSIRSFDPRSFVQTNRAKCEKCIYERVCGNVDPEVENVVC